MCGIVGAISRRDIVPLLVEGLQRLEYRGYDSAGIAVLDGGIKRVRSVGRVAEMQGKLAAEKLSGLVGIGHTRWATHGGVTEPNAHPHVSNDEIAVVHNGIIENHEEHRAKLKQLGYVFESQTDTEVIAHLIHHHFKQHSDLFRATCETVRQLVGAYAIGVICLKSPDVVTGARMGCPLLVGLGEGENFLASDVSAVLSATRRVLYLEDGDVVELRREKVSMVDRQDRPVERKVHVSQASLAAMELGPYEHYMQKEIHEQPKALTDTIEAVVEDGFIPELFGEAAKDVLKDVDGVL
ncbi:MAG: glutamine--fructose-6-phosphate aminotransferase, partial [Gammaproteobacteria bacterium]